jgi:hypothetical protein
MAHQPGTTKQHQANRTPPPNSRFGHIDQGSYGQNGDTSGSVIPPAAAVESVMAGSLRAGQADSKDVLSQVIAKGVHEAADSWQTRTVSAEPLPTTTGCKNPNLNPSIIPGALIKDEAQPVRGPDCAD